MTQAQHEMGRHRQEQGVSRGGYDISRNIKWLVGKTWPQVGSAGMGPFLVGLVLA